MMILVIVTCPCPPASFSFSLLQSCPAHLYLVCGAILDYVGSVVGPVAVLCSGKDQAHKRQKLALWSESEF